MKICPTCKTTYGDDANFCPQETCATANGPQRLQPFAAEARPRFAPQAKIGGGATGEVWRTLDSQSGTLIAYKVVEPSVLPTPAAFGRAERELKQLMRAQSPRIATIIDCGKTTDDKLYVAMELCQGEPIDKQLRNGPLPLEKAKAIVAQVGQALLEAQKAGIVHRDLAPKNILVAPNGEVKVINFPLAKPINDRAAGVAAYLSPEQVQGKPVDQRSNTYNLAAVLYHMLTGEPPFQGSPEQVLELHVGSPPLAPSQRRPEANLSPEVDRVILKALDKNSSRRHLTLRLFLQEVEALTAPAAPAAAAGKDAGAMGYAKTMLFAGGQAEVANLVAKAIAARAPGTGAPPASAAPQPAPRPAPQPAPAAAAAPPASRTPPMSVAQTVAAVPSPVAAPAPAAAPAYVAPPAASPPASAPSDFAEPAARLTPPPVTPYPPSAAPAAAPAAPAAAAEAPPAGGGAKGSAFRETLWFKKGDVEHMIAEAKAKLASSGKPPQQAGDVELPAEDVRPLEDRYVDDGSVSVDDRKKFSLRTGGTTAMPAPREALPGEGMSESELVGEVSSGRKNVVLIVVALIVLALGGAAIMMLRGKKEKDEAPGPAAAAAQPAAPVVAPPPPPAPAAPPPPAAAKPAEEKKPAAAATAEKKSRKKPVDKKKKK